MNADEVVKALRRYAEIAQNNNEFDVMQEFDAAADLIDAMQTHLIDYHHVSKLAEGKMNENQRLRRIIDKLQAALTESQRREKAAVEDMLKVLLSQLEKEKDIISNEHGKDYAHLNFADGRRHTLMRVEAWAKTQIKEWRGPQVAGNQKGADYENR